MCDGVLSSAPTQLLQSELKEVYHLLKRVEGTEDGLTQEHARAALAELNQIMKEVLFPQQQLLKEISVLHPPK